VAALCGICSIQATPISAPLGRSRSLHAVARRVGARRAHAQACAEGGSAQPICLCPQAAWPSPAPGLFMKHENTNYQN